MKLLMDERSSAGGVPMLRSKIARPMGNLMSAATTQPLRPGRTAHMANRMLVRHAGDPDIMGRVNAGKLYLRGVNFLKKF